MAKKKQQKKPLLFIELLIIALIIFCLMLIVKLIHKPSSISQTYTGTFPCADCSGLDTTLILTMRNKDTHQGTYTLQEVYQGKDLKPFITSGTWQLMKGTPKDPNALVLQLITTKTHEKSYFQMVNPETLEMIDQQKNPISSPFNLELFLKK